MKKALHFGAGNIGRGFIGKIISEAGYEVTFVDVNKEVVEELKIDHEYEVEVVGNNSKTDVVKNVNAILSDDIETLNKIGLEISLITMAVGPNVLKIISKSIAGIIKKRCEKNIQENLNIIACENMIKGSTFLKGNVVDYLNDEEQKYVELYVGFVDSAVDRIVPPVVSSEKKMTYVVVEEFYEWIVDETQIKGNLEINGMTKTDNLMAYIERKLFTLNTGHAITAYLGKLKGYKTIDESILDEEIRNTVKSAMQESGEVLIKRYGFDRNAHSAYIDKIIKRFENKYLKDDVKRVGREPIRKLGINERLVKPILGTIEYSLPNDSLLTGIAAALKFDDTDEESIKLKNMLNEKGVEEILKRVTLNALDNSLIAKIMEIMKSL